jgi:isopropylmalate/homocitrate/citramalate synthase/catechol 2,3-dioxygenase-like lactoylglutathione lyase family enzyme
MSGQVRVAEVSVCDVGPRDGLQSEPVPLAPHVRAQFVNLLAAAHVPVIETTSFVRSSLVPQMDGAEQVVKGIDRHEDTILAGLVLNERGYDRLTVTGLERVHVGIGATEAFSEHNAHASVDASLEMISRIIRRAQTDGRSVSAGISVAFGCPFEGRVHPARVLGIAERLLAAGADTVILGDTIGVGVPVQARRLVRGLLRLGARVGVHPHDTRNTALATAYAALEAGATIIEASTGGIGGCPFAPGATGNLATEDLIYLLDREGIETGIDLDGLIGVAAWLARVLERELPGHVYRARPIAHELGVESPPLRRPAGVRQPGSGEVSDLAEATSHPIITGVDHIGVCVPEINEAVALFVDVLGAEKTAEGLSADGVNPVVFVRLGSTDIELFAVKDGAVATLDHLALRVTGDVDSALKAIQPCGVRPDGESVRGSRGEQLVPLEKTTTLGLQTMLHEAHATPRGDPRTPVAIHPPILGEDLNVSVAGGVSDRSIPSVSRSRT